MCSPWWGCAHAGWSGCGMLPGPFSFWSQEALCGLPRSLFWWWYVVVFCLVSVLFWSLPLNHWSLPPSRNHEHCGSAEFKFAFCSYTAFVVLHPVGALYGESKLCLTKHDPQVHQAPHMKQKKNVTPNTYSYWTYYVWKCVGQAVRLLACWMYVTACDVCERGTWTFSFICVIRSGLVKCSAGDVSIVGAH